MKTTDNQNEIFDIVDKKDRVVGQATRGEVHKRKEQGRTLSGSDPRQKIHRSVGVVIFNSKRELFLQQRSATKDTDPLKWTISCSGHVGTAGPAARVSQGVAPSRSRIKSNSTITSKSLALTGVATRGIPRLRHPLDFIYEDAAHRELFEELGIRNLELEPVAKYVCRAPNETEMQVLYRTTFNGPFRLNKEEIVQGKFFTRKELVKLVQLGKLELSFMGRKALEKIGWM